MVALGIWMFVSERYGAGILCIGSAALAFYGLRMSADLDPLWIEIEENAVAIQLRSRRDRLTLTNASARRLSDDEVLHLEGLTSTAGLVFASASFESHRLGACNLFATNLDNAVLLEADNPEAGDGDEDRLRWIVTPDEPDSFVMALQNTFASMRDPTASS